MWVGERTAQIFSPPPLNLSTYGVENEPAAVALATVDFLDELRWQSHGNSGGRHGMIIL
jgi:hypothetical protein